MNGFIRKLSDELGRDPLREKWLLAPSARIGAQWLDRVVAGGVPVLNTRIKTLRHLAVDMALPEISASGKKILRPANGEIIVDRIFAEFRKKDAGYLSRLSASQGLVQAILKTLQEMRLGGLLSEAIIPGKFEVDLKGREISALLLAYEEILARENFIDYADILRTAKDSLSKNKPLAENGVLLVPEGLRLSPLENELLESFPEKMRLEIYSAPDSPEPAGDISLLKFLDNPAEAACAEDDGTLEIFHSVGEINEVREVFRRILGEGERFDRVEILHTDFSTYVPLIYEFACATFGDPAALPITFEEGIPAAYSRPGRALADLAAWRRDDFPQSGLARMLRDGLLKLPDDSPSGARLAGILNSVSIGCGRKRYLPMLNGKRRRLEESLAEGLPENESAHAGENLNGMKFLIRLIENLWELIPHGKLSQTEILGNAEKFLERMAKSAGEFDEYSRQKLLREIRTMRDALAEGGSESFSAWEWLGTLAGECAVEGKGPRPGCVYVAPLVSGGHSGRSNTFVIGLDDDRTSGASGQDPLLLDSERKALSEPGRRLSTSVDKQLERNLAAFETLKRIRGKVTLSYSCLNLIDGREQYPGAILLAAWRILSNSPEDTQADFFRRVPPPASFAPGDDSFRLNESEWWLARLGTSPMPEAAREFVAENFPHLKRGLIAKTARESGSFTEFDGYVPAAGEDLNPFAENSRPLSASQLETLGACPLKYFFEYVLGIKPLDKQLPDPEVWLEAGDRGSLLHAVFQEFMQRLRERDQRPDFSRDREEIAAILNEKIDFLKTRVFPPNDAVFQRESEELRESVLIFLRAEEDYCKGGAPWCLEASMGMEPTERAASELDTGEPVRISLPEDRSIRVRGRIDRVDRLDGGGYAIWDYKTGSARKYRDGSVFAQGRRVQNALYRKMLQQRLRDLGLDGEVSESGYLFSSTYGFGERVGWSEGELRLGVNVIDNLCELLARGCFPLSPDEEDDRPCEDYLPAFGDVRRARKQILNKLASEINPVLDPFRKLRESE